jgi:hypothetical protein
MKLTPGDRIRLTAIVDVTPVVPVGTVGVFVRYMKADDDDHGVILCDFGPKYGPGGQEKVPGRWFVGPNDYVPYQPPSTLVLKPRRRIHL